MAGMVVIFLVCMLVPVGGIIYCMKKTGRTNILFVAIIGLAAMSVANSLTGILTSLKPVVQLADTTFVLYMLIAAVAAGVVENLVRYLTVNYAAKTGVGFFKFLAAGIGLGGGLVMMRASTYMQMFLQARMINSGEFIEAVTSAQDAAVTAAEAQEYIDQIVSLNSFTYYAEALDRIVIVMVQVALTLLFAKFFMEGKKGIGFLITAGLRMVYEFCRLGTYYISTPYLGSAVTETVGLVLNVALLLITAAACVVLFLKIKPLIPAEHPEAPRKKVQQQVQGKKAWNELQGINTKNLSKIEFDDPYENKSDVVVDSEITEEENEDDRA